MATASVRPPLDINKHQVLCCCWLGDTGAGVPDAGVGVPGSRVARGATQPTRRLFDIYPTYQTNHGYHT